MSAVNWDEPSTGSVSNVSPALTLENAKGGALTATSSGVAVAAESKDDEAVVAATDKKLTGRFASHQFLALLGLAPKSIAVAGMNQMPNVAVAGFNGVDPSVPDIAKGIGVLGITSRSEAVGIAGVAPGPRALGVLGLAEEESGVGVRGVGGDTGVEGTASSGYGVKGFTQSTKVAGVYGFGPGAGVQGEGVAGPGVEAHSAAGPGVRALSDQAHGVIGEAKAANAAGIIGRNDTADGVGIDGYSAKGTAVRATSTSGTAVYADALTGRAVDASNFSKDEPAIRASAAMTAALQAYSIGTGVDAIGLETGVVGATLSGFDESDPKIGSGVFGFSLSGAGVRGHTLSGVGVVGVGQPKLGAWAGFFGGNVFVGGALFKMASLFSIDHPLDPERKVLNHASVEAPEYKTFYDGVVTLDARGRARVRLPRWFEALNGDLRYQLTPIGSGAAGLHVAQEVKGGVFVIAGGRPRQNVCWQVTGVRRDAWAKANPLKVERSKRAARPNVTTPSPAELQRLAAALRKKEAALRKEATERERAAKARRAPAPQAPPPVPTLPVEDATAREIANQTIATLERLAAGR